MLLGFILTKIQTSVAPKNGRGQEAVSLPNEPYLGLRAYGEEEQLLFAGRSNEVRDFCHRLGHKSTRVLVLHGRTSCGKTSFLRAGVAPYVARFSAPLEFLRQADIGMQDSRRVLFLRCGRDPLRNFSETLDSISSPAPTSAMPSPLVPPMDEVDDKEIFGRLQELVALRPETLVLVIDQCEEVFTLNNRNSGDQRRLFSFLRFLRRVAKEPIACKLILSLRTEYYGELAFQIGKSPLLDRAVNQFFLPEVTKDQLIEAIRRPALTVLPEYDVSPSIKYNLTITEQHAHIIATSILKNTASGAPLALMQIICRNLWRELPARLPDSPQARPLIVENGFDAAGALATYIDSALDDILRPYTKSSSDFTVEAARWREILELLVVRHSDGTCTTTAVRRELLEAQASRLTSLDASMVLRQLSTPEVAILRFSQNTGEYRLGHDAVGKIVEQWIALRQEREQVRRKEQRKRNRLRWTLALGSLLAILFGCALGYETLALRSLEQTLDTRASSSLKAFVVARALADQSRWRFWWAKRKAREWLVDRLQRGYRQVPSMSQRDGEHSWLLVGDTLVSRQGNPLEVFSLEDGQFSSIEVVRSQSDGSILALKSSRSDSGVLLLERLFEGGLLLSSATRIDGGSSDDQLRITSSVHMDERRKVQLFDDHSYAEVTVSSSLEEVLSPGPYRLGRVTSSGDFSEGKTVAVPDSHVVLEVVNSMWDLRVEKEPEYRSDGKVVSQLTANRHDCEHSPSECQFSFRRSSEKAIPGAIGYDFGSTWWPAVSIGPDRRRIAILSDTIASGGGSVEVDAVQVVDLLLLADDGAATKTTVLKVDSSSDFDVSLMAVAGGRSAGSAALALLSSRSVCVFDDIPVSSAGGIPFLKTPESEDCSLDYGVKTISGRSFRLRGLSWPPVMSFSASGSYLLLQSANVLASDDYKSYSVSMRPLGVATLERHPDSSLVSMACSLVVDEVAQADFLKKEIAQFLDFRPVCHRPAEREFL